ncbi:YdcF family protein [soil metagenome]
MDIDKNAKIIWNYMLMHTPLQKADAIFVLCSHDTRVANRAAELFNNGYAPLVIVSGGAGKLTEDIFDKPEAQVFKDILVRNGVPEDKIIVEPDASNTGENVRFTYALLQQLGKTLPSFILVQKPYMERRTYATFKKQWPDVTTKITVTSPVMSYEDYMNSSSVDKDFVISVMVGDLQRIREYPKLGYQIEQEMPDGVWQAYETLVAAGYNKYLIATQDS